MNPHIAGEGENQHRVTDVMLNPCPISPLSIFSGGKWKLGGKTRVTEGTTKVQCVTWRKEETLLIVRKRHLRLACQHLETKVFNTGWLDSVFPPLCETWYRENGTTEVELPEASWFSVIAPKSFVSHWALLSSAALCTWFIGRPCWAQTPLYPDRWHRKCLVISHSTLREYHVRWTRVGQPLC